MKVAPIEAAQLSQATPVNPQAYQAYLRGLNYAESEITESNIRLSIDMFQKAVDLDPKFALAYAELSRAEGFLYFTSDQTSERLQKSKSFVDRAFELQPGLAEGHVALGYYYYRGLRDYDRALSEFKIAKKTLPNNKTILAGEGTIYRRQGKFQEALAVQKQVIAIDPRDPLSAYDIGTTYSFMRNYTEAQRSFDLSVLLGPDQENGYIAAAMNQVFWKGDLKKAREIINKIPNKNSFGYLQIQYRVELWDRKYEKALDVLSSPYMPPILKNIDAGMIYLLLNKSDLCRESFSTAADLIKKQVSDKPDDSNLRSLLGIAYAGMGRKEEAIREGKLAVNLVPVSKDAVLGPDAVHDLATIYVFTGEKDAAIDQLRYLLSIPSRITSMRLRIEPRWDSVRNDPRFQKLVQTMS